MALKQVGAVLADAKTDLKSLEASTDAIVSTAAAFANNALDVADEWIASETPTIGADVCAHCQQVKADFNEMKMALQSAAGMLHSAKVNEIVAAMVAKITAAFKFACPAQATTTTLAPKMLGDTECLAGNLAEIAVKKV